MVAFALGGRRRSEIASLRMEQLINMGSVTDEDGSPLSSVGINLSRTKTGVTIHDETVYFIGRPVEAVNRWLVAAKIDKDSVFRRIDR